MHEIVACSAYSFLSFWAELICFRLMNTFGISELFRQRKAVRRVRSSFHLICDTRKWRVKVSDFIKFSMFLFSKFHTTNSFSQYYLWFSVIKRQPFSGTERTAKSYIIQMHTHPTLLKSLTPTHINIQNYTCRKENNRYLRLIFRALHVAAEGSKACWIMSMSRRKYK